MAGLGHAPIHADQSFRDFTVEQLAGDLLPDATRAQRIATGFHRNTQINQEGGAKDEENRVNAVIDRIATTERSGWAPPSDARSATPTSSIRSRRPSTSVSSPT